MRQDEYNNFHYHHEHHDHHDQFLEYREPKHDHCHDYHGCRPEFPRFRDDCHDMIQADWAEDRPFKPEFIRNKPNIIAQINNVLPNRHGIAFINAESIGIDGIPNQDIYVVAAAVFPEI